VTNFCEMVLNFRVRLNVGKFLDWLNGFESFKAKCVK
jgi:hypothetical protein